MLHTSCDELVREVGIYFDDKYLVLASPEKAWRKIYFLLIFLFIYYIKFVHFIFREIRLNHYIFRVE